LNPFLFLVHCEFQFQLLLYKIDSSGEIFFARLESPTEDQLGFCVIWENSRVEEDNYMIHVGVWSGWNKISETNDLVLQTKLIYAAGAWSVALRSPKPPKEMDKVAFR
jgi:hypothetical protein